MVSRLFPPRLFLLEESQWHLFLTIFWHRWIIVSGRLLWRVDVQGRRISCMRHMRFGAIVWMLFLHIRLSAQRFASDISLGCLSGSGRCQFRGSDLLDRLGLLCNRHGAYFFIEFSVFGGRCAGHWQSSLLAEFMQVCRLRIQRRAAFSHRSGRGGRIVHLVPNSGCRGRQRTLVGMQ